MTAKTYLTTIATLSLLFLVNGFVVLPPNRRARIIPLQKSLLDDLFGDDKKKDESTNENEPSSKNEDSIDEEDSLSLAAFQQERDRREPTTPMQQQDDDEEEFDGYVLRDILVEKWGEAFDVEFQRVEAMGFKEIYLNVMPFRLGSKRFRHETEMDYLCHLQAVVEILLKYNQVGHVLYQIDATTKKPRAGTSPLVAVPLRLDLTPEQVDKILGP